MKTYTWDYDAKVATQWLRMGGCNGCGECCLITIYIQSTGRPNANAQSGGTGTDQDGVWCQSGANGDAQLWKVGDMLVDEHTHDCFATYGCPLPKVAICEVWPLHPDQVACFDNCSYKFIKLDERGFDALATDSFPKLGEVAQVKVIEEEYDGEEEMMLEEAYD